MALLGDIANTVASIADGDLFYTAEDLTGSYQDGKVTALVFKNYVLTGPLAVIGSASAGASIRLPEDTDNGSSYVAIKAPDSLASTYTLTLPADDGAADEFLKTDGSGGLSWAAVSASTAPLYLDTNTVEQRNGTTAQTFRVYNTYTDASNHERFSVRFSSNNVYLDVMGEGTGSNNRELYIGSSNTFYNLNRLTYICGKALLVGVDTAAYIGTAGGAGAYGIAIGDATNNQYLQFGEMTAPSAPDANNVRIYAEDNGSGKTRLMARFATGASQQLAIEP